MNGSDIEELYPFLYQGPGDAAAVLTEVRRSTAAKAEEIVSLRQSLAVRHGERLLACAHRVAGCLGAGGKLFAFGNGGSGTDAADIAHLFLDPPAGRPLPATSLVNDVCVLTALANDIGYEVVFARQLAAFGHAGDVAVGLSTSGGSANVLRAFEVASRRGMVTIGLAGYDGGKMAEADTIDYLFAVSSSSVHRIQEAQTTVYHVLWELTQQVLSRCEAADLRQACP